MVCRIGNKLRPPYLPYQSTETMFQTRLDNSEAEKPVKINTTSGRQRTKSLNVINHLPVFGAKRLCCSCVVFLSLTGVL
jgi:hypothetical protein